MVEYATEECATCHAIRPMNEMREVKVKRVTGKSYGSGGSRSSTSSHSSGFGGGRPPRMRSGNSTTSRSHSNTRVHMSINRVWVCDGCKAPKSDLSPGTVTGGLVVVGAAAFLVLGGVNKADRTPKAGFVDNSEYATRQYDSDQARRVEVPTTVAPEAVEAPSSEPTETPEPTPSPDADEIAATPSEPAKSAVAPLEQFDGVTAAQKGQREGEEEAARIERAEREKLERYAAKSREP